MTIGGNPRGKDAELVLVNGKIRTPAHPSGFVRAVAISGGVIGRLGSDDDIRDLIGPFTRVIDLRGRLAIPAFGDAHVHPVQGGLESLRCDLTEMRSRQDYLAAIAAYSETLPAGAWVLGGGWSMPAFPGGTPVAADLDAVTGGRPAFLPNRDHHSAWVNSAALAIADVTRDTQDPGDGRIERDHAGNPAGALHDGAMRLVADYVPPPTRAELTAGLLAAQRYLHSLGITSIQDACVGEAGEIGMPDTFAAYRHAAADRLLTCRVTGAQWWDRSRGLHQLDTLLARREEADGGGYFRATSVKLMLNGVCETFTAAMRAPYLDGHGHPTAHAGSLFIEPDELAEIVGRLADLGFQMHFHAIGDRAVTAALDALATLPDALRPAAGTTSRTFSSWIPRTSSGSPRSASPPTSSRCGPAVTSRTTRSRSLSWARSGRTGSTGSARCSGSARASRSAATGRCQAPTRCRGCTWRSTARCHPGWAIPAPRRRPSRCCPRRRSPWRRRSTPSPGVSPT